MPAIVPEVRCEDDLEAAGLLGGLELSGLIAGLELSELLDSPDTVEDKDAVANALDQQMCR